MKKSQTAEHPAELPGGSIPAESVFLGFVGAAGIVVAAVYFERLTRFHLVGISLFAWLLATAGMVLIIAIVLMYVQVHRTQRPHMQKRNAEWKDGLRPPFGERSPLLDQTER